MLCSTRCQCRCVSVSITRLALAVCLCRLVVCESIPTVQTDCAWEYIVNADWLGVRTYSECRLIVCESIWRECRLVVCESIPTVQTDCVGEYTYLRLVDSRLLWFYATSNCNWVVRASSFQSESLPVFTATECQQEIKIGGWILVQ